MIPGAYADHVHFTNLTSHFPQTRAVTLQVRPIPGEIGVLDSIPPAADLQMPFGAVIVGLSRTEHLTITNSDPIHPLVVNVISLLGGGTNAAATRAVHAELPPVKAMTARAGSYRPEGRVSAARAATLFEVPSGYAVSSSALRILLLASGAEPSRLRTSLEAFPDVMAVDYFNASASVPALSNLAGYDVVVVMSDNGFADPIQTGDRLADYVDGGGRVIEAVAALATGGGWELAGRFVTGGYEPFWHGPAEILPHTLGSNVTGHAIMAGVNSLTDGLPARPTLRPGAEWVASWNNGTPLVAVQAGRVVGVNIYAFDAGDYTGDVARLFHNAAVHIARTGFALSNVPALPASVPPLGAMTFDVVFAPDAVGSNAAALRIESNDADEPIVAVQLTGQGILDYLSVTPGGNFISQGHPGGPFNPVSASYTLSNGGPTAINWTVSHTQAWVITLPSGGALAAGQSVNVTVGFTPAANALAVGPHHDRITFSNVTSTHFEQRGVSLTVFTSPIITVAPASLSVTNAEGRSTNVSLVVSNALVADGTLTFRISAQETGRSIQSLATGGVGTPPPGRDFTALAPNKEYKAGRLLVRFAAGVQAAQRGQMLNALGGAQIIREYKVVPGLCLVKLPAGQSIAEALRTFNRTAGILYAEPDYAVKAGATPNDPRFSELWGMNNTGQTGGTPGADIDAPEAWNLNTGSRQVVVAVIDTGVDYTHPDLTNNIWTNSGEIPGNGIDDDNNGYVDDVHGYDFANSDGDPMDDHYHGTHVSGTIGAEGNNGIGVAGVCWKVSIMALKFLDASGNGTTADAISAIEYATLMGARVMNNSWGGGGYEQSLKDAIDAAGAANILFVAAAGNDYGNDNDVTPTYPASYDSPNILSVMATDHDDLMSGFSNFGLTTVDLAGPGTDVLSCEPGGGYRLLSGTSMATPHLAGACALLLSANPLLNVASLKHALLSTVDTNLPGLCVSGGRLNVARALAGVSSTWITITPTGGTNVPPGDFATVTVGLHAGDLAAGSYTGQLIIACNDLDTPRVTIPVSMRILADYLQVTPASLFSSAGAEGGPFAPLSMAYTLTNTGASSLDWAVAHTQNWVSVSTNSGTLTPGASFVVTGLIHSAASLLATGIYADTLVFSNSVSGAIRPRPVALSVVKPMLSIADASVLEGDAGTTNMLFRVSLMPATMQTVTVAYAAANGTAQAGTDYATTNGVLTFLPGQTNATVMVTVFGDTNAEPTETFFVNLSSPTHVLLARSQAVGRILIEDVGPFFDDFDPGIDELQWSEFGDSVGSTVLATNHGGSVSSPNSLWFGSATNRYATSRSLDATLGGVVDFWLRIGSDAGFPWEEVDLPDEAIVLEYSISTGGNWVEFGRYDTITYTVWTHVTVDIPVAAQTVDTRFRWRQLSHSGTCCDHWALDNVAAIVGPRPPTIAMQPANRMVTLGGTTTFTAVASGSNPLSYQWRKDGLNLSDAGRITGTASNRLTIANVQTNDAGLYSILVTNIHGWALSSNAVLTIVDNNVPALGEALDAPELAWTTGGDASWLTQTTNTHDGVDAARSGILGHNEESWVQTTVTGPGTLSFWWKVSSESCCDPFIFFVDGISQAQILGQVDWGQRTFSIAAGTHTLRWTYSKDPNVADGLDAGLLDLVSFVPTVGVLHHFTWSPIATTQQVDVPFPVSLTAQDVMGSTVSNFTGTVAISAFVGGGTDYLRVDFEGGLQGFVIDNNFGSSNGLWHLSTGRAGQPGHSSSNSLYYGQNEGLSGGGNFDNLVLNGGAIISPPITLPAGAGSLTLSFNYLMDVEATTIYDSAIVAVSTNDGVSYTTVASKNSLGGLTNHTGGQWVSNTVSLSAFAGSTLQLRFAFDSIDATGNGTEGWYVDDVVIRRSYGSPVALSPTSTGPFVNGTWSGMLAVHAGASDVTLVADDGLGHVGGSDPFSVVPEPRPVLHIARGVGGTVNLSFESIPLLNYVIEYKNSFSDPGWTFLSTFVGDGSVLTFIEAPTAEMPQRFYRLQLW